METKILDIDRIALEEKLVSTGAQKVFDDVRTITYFVNRKDGGNPFLKLTEEGEKLKLSSQKTQNEEIKLFVSRKDECLQLLATLGYEPISEVRAKRISYELGDIDFDIDEFPGVPAFMEVDLGDDSPTSFENLMTQLGLEASRKEKMSTPEILHLYGKDYFEMYKINN